MTLDSFLANKPLYYDTIDYTRMPRAYESIKDALNLPSIIHVVGTNGKGTTGRFLSLMLKNAGFLVGHYTSPHLFDFNERIWLDGASINDTSLEALHVKLQSLLSKEFIEGLSYFEYTTFLAALAFEKCDFVVMEAGLGGEYDATNVFTKRLSLITPIGMDHESFLGSNIEEIATTKLNSMTTTTIVATQYDPKVKEVAQGIAAEKDIALRLVEESEILWRDDVALYCEKQGYPSFFIDNMTTALFALKELNIAPDFSTLPSLDLPGRCQKIAPNITIDIGHNPMAATILAQSFPLKSQILVYNSFKDKDFAKILSLLMPVVKEIQLIPIQNFGRELDEEGIIEEIEALGLPWTHFDAEIKTDESYLVFGSFMVVESFLGRINAR